MTAILRAQGLSRQVQAPDGRLSILSDVSLSVAAGESLAIVGPSGAGKSTLLGLLAGLDLPSSGTVWLNGVDLAGLDEDGRARLRGDTIGFVFQSFQLLPALTARENVMLPLELAGRGDAGEVASGLLARVGLGGAHGRERHYPRQLSGGEQQRVAIARAFAMSPPLLFADEPSGNLDRASGQRVADLLFEFNRERGATLVLVTHDQTLAQRCQRVLTLEDGRLLADGESSDAA
jgi:putative ABC transport system ATP-binding protein